MESRRNLALSNQNGKNLAIGKNVAMRRWKNTPDQDINFKKSTITSKGRKCLTPHGYLNKDNIILTWWHCNKNKSQQWDRKGAEPKKAAKGKIWNTPFQLSIGKGK